MKKYDREIKILSVSYNEYENLLETRYAIKLEYTASGKSISKSHSIVLSNDDVSSFYFESDFDKTPYYDATDIIIEVLETDLQFSMGADLSDEQYLDADQEWYFSTRRIVFDDEAKEWVSLEDWYPNRHDDIFEKLDEINPNFGEKEDDQLTLHNITNMLKPGLSEQINKKIEDLKAEMQSEFSRILEKLKKLNNDLTTYHLSNSTMELLKVGKEVYERKQRLSRYLLVVNLEYRYKPLVFEDTVTHVADAYKEIESLVNKFDFHHFETKRKQAII